MLYPVATYLLRMFGGINNYISCMIKSPLSRGFFMKDQFYPKKNGKIKFIRRNAV